MDDQRYQHGLTEAFAHITTQPRPASTRSVADLVITKTADVKPPPRVPGAAGWPLRPPF